MPIYEYFCPKCETRFELLLPISQAEQGAECPGCQGPTERVLSSFACRTKDASGAVASVAGTGSSCASCSTSTCSGCSL